MQNTLENWKQMSLLFVAIFGGLHLSASFLLIQGWQNPNLDLIVRGLDLPFLLATLSFAVSQIALTAEESLSKGALFAKISGAFAGLILIAAVLFNLLVPDAKFF